MLIPFNVLQYGPTVNDSIRPGFILSRVSHGGNTSRLNGYSPYWNTLLVCLLDIGHLDAYTLFTDCPQWVGNVLQYSVILWGDDIPIRSQICRSRSVWYCYHIEIHLNSLRIRQQCHASKEKCTSIWSLISCRISPELPVVHTHFSIRYHIEIHSTGFEPANIDPLRGNAMSTTRRGLRLWMYFSMV